MSALSGPVCTFAKRIDFQFLILDFLHFVSFLFCIFCFISLMSGPVCTLGVANELIFCFCDFRLTILCSRHLSKFNLLAPTGALIVTMCYHVLCGHF